MKKIVIGIILMAIAILYPVSNTFGQSKERRAVSSFNQISYAIPGELHLKQGTEHQVVIEGGKNNIKNISIEVKGNTLTIKSKENSINHEKIIVWVTFESLSKLSISGSGKVIGETSIMTDKMHVVVSGSGDTHLDVNSNGNLDIDITGSGNVHINGSCVNSSSRISGSGEFHGTLSVAADARVNITGSGKVHLSGMAKKLNAVISGSGNLHGLDFMTVVGQVKIGGSGHVEIAVKEELTVSISGSGCVSYKGDPHKVNNHSTGSGRVTKV